MPLDRIRDARLVIQRRLSAITVQSTVSFSAQCQRHDSETVRIQVLPQPLSENIQWTAAVSQHESQKKWEDDTRKRSRR